MKQLENAIVMEINTGTYIQVPSKNGIKGTEKRK